MPKQRAFTIIELMVAIAIIAVMVGLLFPAIGAVRRAAKKQENNTKVRNILQGMITYSSSHRDFFPGFDGFEFTADGVDTTGNSGRGQTAEARYWILLDGNYTVGEGLISSSETKDIWQRDAVTTDHYSYALLKLNSTSAATLSGADAYRREEWRNEQNPLAPLVSDRLVREGGNPTIGNADTYLSIHDGSVPGKWQGSIGFGDLSVEFTDTPKVPTRFAGFNNADRSGTPNNEDDDIFDDGDSWASNSADLNKQAGMTYEGHYTPDGPVE